MTTQESTPTYARDIQPLFRARDRASMSWAFDLWNYHDVSTHAQAILERLSSGYDAVRREVVRGADRSISQVGRSRDACVVPLRLTPPPNFGLQHEIMRLLGWLILRSGLPGLTRFDVLLQYRRQPAKVFPDCL